ADRGAGPVVGRDLQPGPRGPAVGAQPRGAVVPCSRGPCSRVPCSRGHRAGDHRGVTARGDVRDARHMFAGAAQAELRGGRPLPAPPATSVAGWPSAAWPPPGEWTGARCQLAPASAETRNCWRTTPSLVCEPVVTIVLPTATMRLMTWKTPRCCCPG